MLVLALTSFAMIFNYLNPSMMHEYRLYAGPRSCGNSLIVIGMIGVVYVVYWACLFVFIRFADPAIILLATIMSSLLSLLCFLSNDRTTIYLGIVGLAVSLSVGLFSVLQREYQESLEDEGVE